MTPPFFFSFSSCTLAVIAAGVLFGEAEHAQRIADEWDGRTEQVLWDRTRCDIVTETHAIEVDWAPKWAEAIGQSLYYSIVLDLEPGIVLLAKDGEERFVYRCQTVCAREGIKLWVESVP